MLRILFSFIAMILLLSSNCLVAQKAYSIIGNEYPEIDSTLRFDNYNFIKEGKYKEGIEFNYELIKKSRQKNYKRGVGWAYINIGNILSILNQYDESLKYLELAEKELIDIEDPFLKAKLYIETGKVNHCLGLYEIALTYYNKAITEAKKNKDLQAKASQLNYVYACKANNYNFEFLNQIDSMLVYFRKAYKSNQDPITAANIADYFIVHKKDEIDSAKYYLETANKMFETNIYDLFQKFVILRSYGDFYYEQKEYEKSLDNYFQALSIAEKLKKNDSKKLTYQLISKTYQALGENEKSFEFTQKYTNLNDSLNLADKKALNLSVEKLIKDKEQEQEAEKQKITRNRNILIVLISFLALISIFIIYYIYRKKRKEKEKLILQKQKEINQKELEKIRLEHKVNDAFEEIIELAQKNDPAFLARFKEVYPEFCEKILNLYPDIINSEFIFCAYLKLNFTTKEIANYTFVTTKAVQARKTRIRKKLGISSEEDIYIWFNKLDA